MRGEVTVRVECLMPDRLIQRATAAGARFDEVRRLGERTLQIRCDCASERQLLALCERYSLPARVTDRRGGSAVRRFARRRPTLPAGLALAAVLCALFLSRLWFVDIAFSGETAALGNRAALARSLEALDVRPGVSRRLDTALIAQTLQAGTGAYSYVGLRLQGVRLLVEAVPETPAPSVYDVDAGRDLVCGMDGIVTRAVVRSGELCVKPGDVVRRGQLLIRGEERSGKEETRSIAALGEVDVRTWYEGSAALPLTVTRWSDTGRRSVGSTLIAPGRRWPIVPVEDFPSQRVEREYLPICGLFVPLEIERVTHVETVQNKTDVGMDILKPRLRALALADAVLALARSGPDAFTIERSWVDYEAREGDLTARAVLELQTDAAVTREALRDRD